MCESRKSRSRSNTSGNVVIPPKLDVEVETCRDSLAEVNVKNHRSATFPRAMSPNSSRLDSTPAFGDTFPGPVSIVSYTSGNVVIPPEPGKDFPGSGPNVQYVQARPMYSVSRIHIISVIKYSQPSSVLIGRPLMLVLNGVARIPSRQNPSILREGLPGSRPQSSAEPGPSAIAPDSGRDLPGSGAQASRNATLKMTFTNYQYSRP